MMNSNRWFFSPFVALLLAFALLASNDGTGMDGAARTTALLFWFFPAITWLGYMSFVNLARVDYSKTTKGILIALWLIPSLPLCLVSLFGIMLLSETGFGILS